MEKVRVCWKGILKITGFLFALGIVGYVFFQASNLRAESATSKEIAKEIQKIKDAGEPTSIEELVPLDIPDSENGALVYSQAFNLLKELMDKHKDEWKYFPYEGEVKWSEVPEVEKEKVKNLLLQNQDFVRFYQLLEKASGMKCQFVKRKDYEKGFEMKLPHLASLRSCARMLAARADIHAENGEIDSALHSCFTCLKISNSLLEEPTNISGLFGMAIDQIALTRMEEIMKKGDANLETYRALMKEITKARNDKIMYQGLLGERIICGIIECTAIKKQAVEEKNIEPIVERLLPFEVEEKDIDRIIGIIQKDPVGFVDKNELVYLKTMAKWITLSKKSYFEARKEFSSFEKDFPTENAVLAQSTLAYSRTLIQEARIDAQLGTAEIALACHLYKAKHKDYPVSLKELFPEFLSELPLDSFTGKDYIYRKKDKGFIVYSVGENLKDDGGKLGSPKRWEGDCDIVWEE